MYDLNLTVPNFTSPKYSDDNRFLLLKNYLYELNDTLAYALSDKTQTLTEKLTEKAEKDNTEKQQQILRLKKESLRKFDELKERIIRTADDIVLDYTTELSKSEEKILSTARGEFATKTEFGEYKNGVKSEFEQTASDISALVGTTEEVTADLENFKSSVNSQFTVQAETVMSQVENVFSAKTEVAALEERINSQITQSSENITEIFSQSVSQFEDDISSIGGELSELISSLEVYIRHGKLDDDVYGIEIGRNDSDIKARFTNDRLSFYQGVAEVAYISGSNLYITRAEILDYLKLGNSTDGYFGFDVTQNGLEVRWFDGG